MKREQVALGNGHAVPKNSSPLNGKSKLLEHPGSPLNSHALNEVLSNNKPHGGGILPGVAAEHDGPRPSPFLEIIGLKPPQRPPSRSIILSSEAEHEKLPGSRGMDQYDELDQRLMIIGDEKSNNAEEMRKERAEIRRNRVKNNKLFRQAEEEDQQQ
jgi:hypothetical protein